MFSYYGKCERTTAGFCYIIEIKQIHSYDTPQTVREEGLEQIRGYRDRIASGAPSYLIIFDHRPAAKQKSWDERIIRYKIVIDGK